MGKNLNPVIPCRPHANPRSHQPAPDPALCLLQSSARDRIPRPQRHHRSGRGGRPPGVRLRGGRIPGQGTSERASPSALPEGVEELPITLSDIAERADGLSDLATTKLDQVLANQETILERLQHAERDRDLLREELGVPPPPEEAPCHDNAGALARLRG